MVKQILTICTLLILFSNTPLNAQVYEKITKKTHGSKEKAYIAVIEKIGNNINEDERGIYYQRIIETTGKTKSENYSNALVFFSENYISGESVIDMQDEVEGVIIGKGILVGQWVDTHIQLRVDVKDGMARAILREFGINGEYETLRWRKNDDGSWDYSIVSYYNESYRYIMAHLDKLEEHLKGKSSNIESQKW